MFRIVFVILISVSFIFANNIQESMAKDNFYGQSEQKFHGPNFKFEGNRTKVYNDSIVVDFKIYCGNWIERKFFSGEPDSVKKCWLMAKDGKSSIDSVVHKNVSMNYMKIFMILLDFGFMIVGLSLVWKIHISMGLVIFIGTRRASLYLLKCMIA